VPGVVGKDPVYVPLEAPGPFARFAFRLINDPRDLPFVTLTIKLAVIMWSFAVYLAWPGHFRWWLAVVYLATFGFFLGPYVLMLHNTSHRRLYKKEYAALNYVIPWLLGPFFGETPETYNAHHVGMHHHEDNLRDDLSTTMPYQRDSFAHFMIYFGKFMFIGLFELVMYFAKRKRWALMRRTIVGELSFVMAAGALMAFNWRAGLTIFVLPLVIARFAMMAGNWAQHAFVCASAPDNNYKNSITCIDSGYNRRCFNDGYHIGHHLKRTQHWTDMPVEFTEKRATYASEGAIVFRGVDFFAVWFFLMLKRYDWLVARYVQLGDEPLSPSAIESMLRERTRAFPASSMS
jgi:hypothetical protein